MKHFPLIPTIFIIAAQAVVVNFVTAQNETPSAQPAFSGHSLEAIKGEISALLEENKRLEEEYFSLKSRLLEIQGEINQQKLLNRDLEGEIARTKRLMEKERFSRDELTQKTEQLQREITNKENELKSLKEQLSGFEDRRQAWHSKIAELEAQKNQLNLEIGAQKALQEKIRAGEAAEIQQLKDELTALQKQETEADQSLIDLEQQSQRVQEEMAALRAENQRLEAQRALLEKQRAEKMKENARLLKENPSDNPEYTRKLQEKKALEAKVRNLEEELEKVKKTLEASSQLQARKRALLDEIMALDKENRQLRQTVADIKADIDVLKAQTPMTKAAEASR